MVGSSGNRENDVFGPCRLSRRRFLGAASAVPLAVALAACSDGGGGVAPPSGPDLSGVDAAIRPQDDLFRHVNGGWLRDYRLPADKPAYGAFEEVTERTEDRLRVILESLSGAPDSSERKLRDLYDAHLDTAAIDRLGIEPLADLLDDIDRAATKSDLARLMGVCATYGIPGLVRLEVRPDRKDSTRSMPYLVQAGLGLPDESYYREPQYDAQRAAYRTYLERITEAAGRPAPGEVAARVLDIETRIAGHHLDLVRFIASMSSYNRYEWDRLAELAPGFDWNAWRAGITDRPERFGSLLVDQPEYLTAVARLWEQADIAIWRDYLRVMVIGRYAPMLAKGFADAHFACFDKALQGTEQPPERWRTAVRMLQERMGDALGKQYVARHFPAESKQQVEELVRDLLSAYRSRFGSAPWMAQSTRDAAVAKVDNIIPVIGYPQQWRDYSGLTVSRERLVAGVRAVDQLDFRRRLGNLGEPVDRQEWTLLTPAVVNANYSWELNHIIFPAAILQPPFFDPAAERAVNYGTIGMVIGHEIGHGFDSEGSKYDANGNLRDWWTPQDKAAFEAMTKTVVEQYDPLVPAGATPGNHVNGALTVTENLADIRGLTIALAAFRIAEERRGVTDPDFRPFFLAYARMWRHAASPEYVNMLVNLDPHAPAEFRVNQAVRNMPEFHSAFGVQPPDGMFLAPERRITL